MDIRIRRGAGELEGAVPAHTILTRLGRKRLVASVQARYHPTKDAAELVAEQMRAALELGADQAEVLRPFVRSLDDADVAAVRALPARE
ncbi:hypothetical protein E0H75_41820 [Kribbella capetownensis]|uniref:Uncharacterized protein n=1 Tax=Kribbella capetownensis TaxID=1572659 RepID=A0A4R0IPT6_9ACTN|nr:hypothetical protein [Kribbella capetownensis]TCC34550.1 hypothetical protein E0H75_41820 [Kribbella capetownensis]